MGKAFERIDPADYVFVDTHQRLAAETGCVYRTTEFIHELFANPESGCPVLVSGCCDFSLREQEQHHPNADLSKRAAYAEYDRLAKGRDGYHRVMVGPCCEPANCHPRHKYVLKADRHAVSTFEDVPPAIRRWYTTNLDVKHDRISWLPFGLNNDGDGWTHVPEVAGRKKTGLLYMNFQNNTVDRLYLKRHFQNKPWVTVRMDVGLPVDQFLAEVAEHKFVMTPFGNGLDSYRCYEAMYTGSIPLIEYSVFAEHLLSHSLPAVAVGDYYQLSERWLEAVWEKMQACDTFRHDALKASYWKTVFAKGAG